jgi:hypothetical protein
MAHPVFRFPPVFVPVRIPPIFLPVRIPPVFVPVVQNLRLNGSASGTLLVGINGYQLTGSGPISPLGSPQLHGTVQGIGFVPQGFASGSVVPSNSQGSVNLKLTGPLLFNGPQPPPSGIYQFTITGGTGAYAHAVGSGTVNVNLAPNIQFFSMVFSSRSFRSI